MDAKREAITPKKAASSSKQEDDDPFTPSRPTKVDLDLTPRGGPSTQVSIPATPSRNVVEVGPSNKSSIPSPAVQNTPTGAAASISSPLGASTPAPPSALSPLTTTENNDTVNIRIRDGADAGVTFKVKRTTRMEKVMHAYCQRANKRYEETRFIFDGGRVEKDHTPASLEMEDDEIIDVVMEQIGGCQV